MLTWPDRAAQVTVVLDPGADRIREGTGRAIHTLNGEPLQGGYFGIGAFDLLPDFQSATPAQIESAFRAFGPAASVNGMPVGPDVISLGTLGFSFIQSLPAGSELVDRSITIVIADGPTIADSRELLVIDSGLRFEDDDPIPSLNSINLQTFAGTPLWGSDSFADGVFEFVPEQPFTFPAAPNSYQTAPLVPEQRCPFLASSLCSCSPSAAAADFRVRPNDG